MLMPITTPRRATRLETEPLMPQAELGLKQVSAIVTAVLVPGQFETNQSSNQKTLTTLWEHAIASATIAKHLRRIEQLTRNE